MNIDYRAMPEVQAAMQKLEAMRQSNDILLRESGGNNLYAFQGTEFTIVVRVIDPALAQLALLSVFSVDPAINLPGLRIAEIRVKDADSKQVVKAWLEERLKELDG